MRLTSTVRARDVLFAFDADSFAPVAGPCSQQAIRDEIEGASLALTLGYAGIIGFDPQSEFVECGEPAPAIGDPFHLHVQVEGEPEILLLVGEAMAELLREFGFDAKVAPCDDGACIRVHFGVDGGP